MKALTQFPSVLASMDRNLSWTSALGDAYVNQPQDVLDAVQTMRDRAMQAGDLQSSTEETVTVQGETIVIQPATPDVVYVRHTTRGSCTARRFWRIPMDRRSGSLP